MGDEVGETGEDNFFCRNCSRRRAFRLIFEGVLWQYLASAGAVLAGFCSPSLESKEN